MARPLSRPVAVLTATVLHQRARAPGGLAAAEAWGRGRSAEGIRRSLAGRGAVRERSEVEAAAAPAGRLPDAAHLEAGEAAEPAVHLEDATDRPAPGSRRPVVAPSRESVAERSTGRVAVRSAKAARPAGRRRAAVAWARRLRAVEAVPERQVGRADRYPVVRSA